MTRIDKYGLDRMLRKDVAISFRCPHCEGVRLEMNRPEQLDPLEGIQCFKCKAVIVLDSLSVAVIQEGGRRPAVKPSPRPKVRPSEG